MDTEAERINSIVKESNAIDWLEDSRVETERILGKVLGSEYAFDQCMKPREFAENQLKHLMDEELVEELDENNNIIYKKLKQ